MSTDKASVADDALEAILNEYLTACYTPYGKLPGMILTSEARDMAMECMRRAIALRPMPAAPSGELEKLEARLNEVGGSHIHMASEYEAISRRLLELAKAQEDA